MHQPLISVIIPAYNQAEYLGSAVQSVLDQTYPNFEVIVVDDHSPDGTARVAMQFTDPRVRYIVHDQNQGVSAARNTGMNASSGEVIALLDADDRFHCDKLKAHVSYLNAHPEVGVSYNSRFEMNHSSDTVRELWRARSPIGLLHVLFGFPFSPSDMVIRREWAFMVGLFDPSMGTAEDTDFPCRLALAGCQFGAIDRALNYRNFHSGRKRWNLPKRVDDVRRAQAAVFADPRCPAEAHAFKPLAMRLHLLDIVTLALVQEETSLALQYLEELLSIYPAVVQGMPSELTGNLLSASILDESEDHEALLKTIFSQLPPELNDPSQLDWAIKRGWLWKGVRAMIWGRPEEGLVYFDRAVQSRAHVDDELMRQITSQILGYKIEFGCEAAAGILTALCSQMDRLSDHAGDKLRGCYYINRAFEVYGAGSRREALSLIMQAVQKDSSYMTNPGVLSMVTHSLFGSRS